MKQLLFSILTILALLFAMDSNSFTVPNDTDYYQVKNNDYTYIYGADKKEHLIDTINLVNSLKLFYDKSFDWTLDETPSFVLTSNKNQVDNAFATISPNYINTYFSATSNMFEGFAIESWRKTVIAHEFAHLYQLSSKRGPSKVSKAILGNNPIPFTPFPWFSFPNILLPTPMIEGNAVFNESIIENGGRLYSGEHRAKFLNLLSFGRITERRFTNEMFQYPYSQFNYIVGAYYFENLAHIHGIDKANQFFINHATHYFNPFRVSSTLKELYGMSYSSSLYSMMNRYQDLASTLERGNSDILISSRYISEFNQNKNNIYFLSTDANNYPTLAVFSKKNKQFIKKEKVDLKMGKPFVYKGNYTTASSGLYDRTQIIAGLWGESKKLYKETESKLITDIRNKKVAYFKVDKSFDIPSLYINNKFYSKVHSKALFDKNGNVYYFKQNGKIRSLYKNKTKLYSYKGYYGKIADISETGEILFIGPIKRGSSLFIFSKGKTYRAARSDLITQAKFIDNKSILISELSLKGEVIKIIRKRKINATPYLYKYNFQGTDKINLTSSSLTKSEQKNINQDTSSYNSLTSTRFSSLEAKIGYSSRKGEKISLTPVFTDRMMKHQFIFNTTFYKSATDNHEMAFNYINSKYLLNWSLLFSRETLNSTTAKLLVGSDHITEFGAGLSYHLFQKGNWNSFLKTYYIKDNFVHDKGKSLTKLEFRNVKNGNLSMFAYDAFTSEFSFYDDIFGQQTDLELAYSKDLYKETYISLDSHTSYTNRGYLNLGESIIKNITSGSSNGLQTYELFANENTTGQLSSLGIQKVFQTGLYSTWFPFGLRRTSIGPKVSHYYVAADSDTSFFEYGANLNLEALAFHKIPVLMTIEYFKRPIEYKNEILNIQMNFNF